MALQIRLDGYTGSLSFHCRRLGLCIQTVMARHRRGESYTEALTNRTERPRLAYKYRKRYTVKGVKGTVAELAAHFGIKRDRVRQRMRDRHWSLERALTEPVGVNTRRFTYKGVTGTVKQLTDKFGVVLLDTVKVRLRRGWSIDAALSTPFVTKEQHSRAELKGKKPSPPKKVHTITCRFLTYKNESHSISEWERIMHLPSCTIGHRLRRGWSVKDAITRPMKKWRGNTRFAPRQPIVLDGKEMTICEHCARLGINCHTVLYRIRRGWDIEDAFRTPIRKYAK